MFSFLLYSLLRIKRYNTYAWIMSCIQQGCRQRGAWGLQPPQFLTDQLTLSQPGGADYARHSTPSPPPPDFQTLRRACTGCRMLKLASNLGMVFFYFFVYTRISAFFLLNQSQHSSTVQIAELGCDGLNLLNYIMYHLFWHSSKNLQKFCLQ